MLRTRQFQSYPPSLKILSESSKIARSLANSTLINHGYHQFSLDEQSRKIMTFSTPLSNYPYKRLTFGGLNCQDLFRCIMAKILSGIPPVLNNRDKIMIGGIDWQDHNGNLKPTLPRIEDHNHTLRKEKCEFGQTTMDFHGRTLYC